MGKVFSQILSELRTKRGMTQRDVAFTFGVSPNAVFKWENGTEPSFDMLEQLANFFNVSIDYLLGRPLQNSSPQTLTVTEKRLLEVFGRLDPLDQGQVIGFANGLAENAANVQGLAKKR